MSGKILTCLIKTIILALPISVAGQTAPPSLEELIGDALNKDYGLANKTLDIQRSAVEQKKLKEAYLPRIDFTAKDAFIYSSIRLNTPEIEIPQLNIATQEGRNRFNALGNLVTANLGATALIYSGGKIPQLKKALQEKINAQTALLEKDREEIISEVITAYDQLALLRQIRLVLDDSEKRLREDKKTADKAFGYGLITKYEHQKIEVAQAQLASRIEDYEGRREVVLEYLYLLTNVEKERLGLLLHSLQPIENIETGNTIENRPELRAFKASIAAHNYLIKAEKTWFIPKVQAVTNLGYLGLLAGRLKSSEPVLAGGQRLSSTLPDINILPMLTVGIGMKWELFNGNEGKREVELATLALDITRNEEKEVTEKLELNLSKRGTDFKVALSQITVRKTQLETAKNALQQATNEYRTGLIKSSQLVDAEEDMQNAALGYIEAIYNQRRAAIALLQATGNLTAQTVKE